MNQGGELARERYVSLATFRRNGTEVKTPVWFAVIDGKLYVVSAGNAGKVKRLRHSPKALVAVSDRAVVCAAGGGKARQVVRMWGSARAQGAARE